MSIHVNLLFVNVGFSGWTFRLARLGNNAIESFEETRSSPLSSPFVNCKLCAGFCGTTLLGGLINRNETIGWSFRLGLFLSDAFNTREERLLGKRGIDTITSRESSMPFVLTTISMKFRGKSIQKKMSIVTRLKTYHLSMYLNCCPTNRHQFSLK